jgi:hypothetical protein
MDYIKFIILIVACTGGFIATSYSYLAKEKGWSTGRLFGGNNHEMTYMIWLGNICQFGSVIISFFVNPWWSAFLVLFLGFIGYMVLANIFKTYSQVISGILILASFILVPIYVFN